MEPDRDTIRRQLLPWYRARKRDLPFRRTKDPYAILVAEVILQRTRVKAGVPYYERFLAAFPTVRDLAAAPETDVLRAWEGLGFYGRARNLHRTAKAIASEFGGKVPEDFEVLRSLPGIGGYTAGAVASIAFGIRVPAVDGNVTRVLSRLYRIEGGKGLERRRRIHGLAADLVPDDAPGEWNQAIMELGATVCVPRAPRCRECPISGECLAFLAGVQSEIPRSAAKPKVPTMAVAFVVASRGDSVLLVRREEGLHSGLYALPGGEVADGETAEAAAGRHLRALGLRANRLEALGPIRHTFSHLRWEGVAFRAETTGRAKGGQWVPRDRLPEIPIVPVHRALLASA